MNTWLLLALAGVADSALVDDSDVRRCSLAVQAINKRQQAQLDTLGPSAASRGIFFSGEGRVYSSASGGARNTMIAARSPRPNVGKK
jgi:hypothetical protein